MIKKLFNWIKELIKKKDGKIHNYHQFKNTYVKYGNNQPKIKLRSHLSKLASNINDINYKGYAKNRISLIEEFEYGGLESVGKFADNEINIFVEKSKEKR